MKIHPDSSVLKRQKNKTLRHEGVSIPVIISVLTVCVFSVISVVQQQKCYTDRIVIL